MTIGEKIKCLRKENDVTQEKLAEYLGISYQAISKWENNTACPDITFIVPLANFFAVTTDELFSRNDEDQKKEIEEFQNEGLRLANLGLVKDELSHWRSAALKHPKNYQCLTNLAYSLLNVKSAEIFDKEETDKCLSEAIQISQRILADCTENVYRSSATQILVIIYGNKNGAFYDEEKAVKYATESTDLYCSAEILLESAYGYNSEKAVVQKHLNNLTFIDLLSQNITLQKYSTTEEEITALKTMLGIWNAIFYDGNFLFYHCRIAQIYRNLAIKYARIGKTTDAIDALYSAKKHAIADMNITEGEHQYTSIYICKATHNSSLTSKNFTGSQLDLIYDILNNDVFDTMRDSQEFKAFEQSLFS